MQTIAQEAKLRLLLVDAILSKLIATNVWVISVGSDSFAHSVRCAGVGSWVGAQGGVGGGGRANSASKLLLQSGAVVIWMRAMESV